MHYFVPRENLHYLAKNQHLLNKRQINDVAKAHQTGKGIHISAPKTQSGGFLGTLLASIGVPLVLDMVKKMTGSGGPQIGAPPPPKRGRGGPQIGAPPPPKRGRVVLKLVLLHLFLEIGLVILLVEVKKKRWERESSSEKTAHSMGFLCYERCYKS